MLPDAGDNSCYEVWGMSEAEDMEITPDEITFLLRDPEIQKDPDFQVILDAALLYIGYLVVIAIQPNPKPVLPPYEYPEYVPLSVAHDIIGNNFNHAWIAERFIERYQNVVRYCAPMEKYYVWDGGRWVPDDYKEIQRLCHDHIIDLIHDEHSSESEPLLKRLVGSISAYGIRGVMFFLECNRLTVRKEELDADPDRVNVLNGVINLGNCEYEPPDRDRFITRRMNVEFDPEATCPLWMDHLNLIFAGDRETIESFQMIAGYSLLRANPEQLFFIHHGAGENGKSVTVNVLSQIFGEYALNADPRTFQHRRSDDATVRCDVARLYGAHLVTALESGNDVRLNESLLKAITGNDKITSRHLWEEEQESKLEAKIWFITNHEPLIKDSTWGMLRRIIKIPYAVQIPIDKRDDQIEQKLIAESPGIFNWMLDGLMRWYENGRKLKLSKAITDATVQFRSSIDEFREFFETDIEITGKETDRVLKQSLFEHFCLWYSDRNGEQPAIRQQAFNKICLDHKITKDHRARSGKWEWIGVRILSSLEREDRQNSAYASGKNAQNDEPMNPDEPYPYGEKFKNACKKIPDKVHHSSSVHHHAGLVYICGSMCGDLERKNCRSVPSKCGRGVPS